MKDEFHDPSNPYRQLNESEDPHNIYRTEAPHKPHSIYDMDALAKKALASRAHELIDSLTKAKGYVGKGGWHLPVSSQENLEDNISGLCWQELDRYAIALETLFPVKTYSFFRRQPSFAHHPTIAYHSLSDLLTGRGFSHDMQIHVFQTLANNFMVNDIPTCKSIFLKIITNPAVRDVLVQLAIFVEDNHDILQKLVHKHQQASKRRF